MRLLLYAVEIHHKWQWFLSIAPAVDQAYWNNKGNYKFLRFSEMFMIDEALSIQTHLNTQNAALFFQKYEIREVDTLTDKPGFRISDEYNVSVDWLHHLYGRALLLHELSRGTEAGPSTKIDEQVQIQYLKGVIEYQAGMTNVIRSRTLFFSIWQRKTIEIQCQRCGATEKSMEQTKCASCGQNCYYCLQCLTYGRVRQCSILIVTNKNLRKHKHGDVYEYKYESSNLDAIYDFKRWSLTPEQTVASKAAIKYLSSPAQMPKTFLIWAVTGAGKTETIFPLIHFCRQQHQSVAIVTPRKDVVLELQPRIRKAFPNEQIVTLYGDSDEKWHHDFSNQTTPPLLISTTHQLIRFYQAFDFIIIDEVDAFPYHNNPMLQFAVRKSQKEKAKSVWLSATPTEDMIRDWKRGELEVSIISRRYHGYPLPEPVFVRLDPLITLLKRQNVTAPLLRKIKTSILRSAQLFIFVSRISDVEPLVNLLRENICPGIVQTKEIDGVSSQESHRTLKITSFRQGAIRILVTTTILERGITIPFSDVIVMDADNERFQTHQLIQIAGRAGRSQEDPHGHVWFCAKTWNKQQKNACAQIKKLNKLAKPSAKQVAKSGFDDK